MNVTGQPPPRGQGQHAPAASGTAPGPSQLRPFLKWPGGKSHELAAIRAARPAIGGRYIEPFVGGAAVLLDIPPSVPAYANDASVDLIHLYRGIAAAADDTRDELAALAGFWTHLAHPRSGLAATYHSFAAAYRGGTAATRRAAAELADRVVGAAEPALTTPLLKELHTELAGRAATDLDAKIRRMRRIEERRGPLPPDDIVANAESALRSSWYVAVRGAYNARRAAGRFGPERAALFFVLRELCYAAMFRFNADGDFNVPYGGITYNRKDLAGKVARAASAPVLARLRGTTWSATDFADFLAAVDPRAGDLVFLDPPYDADFSAYDDRPFGVADHLRLAEAIRDTPAAVQLVIADTPLVRETYALPGWTVTAFDKTYMWTIKSRNDRRGRHLLIQNRPIG